MQENGGSGFFVYLAGKISPNDWRTEISTCVEVETGGICGEDSLPREWPVSYGAISGAHHYVGPYFVSCDHQCFHGSQTHGAATRYDLDAVSDEQDWQLRWYQHQKLSILCRKAIALCDMFFAWIDSEDAYGTIAEIGYAAALDKPIYLAGPREFKDLWFIYHLDSSGRLEINSSPVSAFYGALDRRQIKRTQELLLETTESPVERMYLAAWLKTCPIENGIEPQLQVGPYRVDFAIPGNKTVVEIDGHEFHKTKEQRTHDARRERYLEMAGWRVIRFTGTEVFEDPFTCVADTLELIRTNGTGVAS